MTVLNCGILKNILPFELFMTELLTFLLRVFFVSKKSKNRLKSQSLSVLLPHGLFLISHHLTVAHNYFILCHVATRPIALISPAETPVRFKCHCFKSCFAYFWSR